MVAAKGIVAYVIILAIVVIIWYLSTGFALPHFGPTTTVYATSSTTTKTTASSSTTTINSPTTSTTTINSIFISPCVSFFEYSTSANAVVSNKCDWTGGALGIWLGAGYATNENVKIIGDDGKTYINYTTGISCVTFYRNYTFPAQNYTVTLSTGNTLNTSRQCQYSSIKMNTTLTPPKTVYSYVYNGNFSSGTYAGWSLTGNGFGQAPLNITFALTSNTAHNCFLSGPWKNYNETFIATTFNCGISNAPGNITSSLFYANKPFLNFRIISPQDSLLYVEILNGSDNNTPWIIAHYDTYNITLGSNAPSTFYNASIPLVTVLNRPVAIRVVADTLNREYSMAVEGFALANKPKQDQGVLYGPYNFTH